MHEVVPAPPATRMTAGEFADDLMLDWFQADGAFSLSHAPLLLVDPPMRVSRPQILFYIYIFYLEVLQLLIRYPDNVHLLHGRPA